MKPPPRQRILTKRYEESRTVRKQVRDRRGLMENVCTWGVTEQRRLLKGLEWLKRHRRVEPDIDYEWLQKRVPKRSIEQVSIVRSARRPFVGLHTRTRTRKHTDDAEVGIRFAASDSAAGPL